nr:uncharacterized mitochondrial protein AtMg00810-like [Tanacetum cinerariifolium]
MGQTNQTVHMIMPSKNNLYNGRKGIGFKNPSYFEKAKDLRPTLYDEKVIGLGYTLMFLIHSDEALKIKKFKRSRENKIDFAYDYGNLNASYVNEKINFEDDYFQEIINPDFEKIDSPFHFESSEKVCSELENQTENDCLVVEKECDKEENPKVIAPGMFKLNVSQCVSSISMSKSSCDSNNVEIKLKRKRLFTPMVEQAKLKLGLVGKPIDQTDYRNMIGSLMYVTSSRPDIMFVTSMRARYQANPNEHHVSAVKRIFRYLKRTINLGFWYLKDSGFDLTTYSDADHVGCHLDQKSTSGSV